jgi:hypothetical protein
MRSSPLWFWSLIVPKRNGSGAGRFAGIGFSCARIAQLEIGLFWRYANI